MASTGLTKAIKGTCTICGNENRVKINAELNRGLSQRGIAHRYGVESASVRRHFNSRHPGVKVEEDEPIVVAEDGTAAEPGAVAREKTPREKLEGVIRGLEKQAVGGAYRVEVARELRIAYAELDKMVGGVTVHAESYREVEGWAELEAAIFAALRPWPDATKAVARALGGEVD